MAFYRATDFGSTALATPGPRTRGSARSGLCRQGSRPHARRWTVVGGPLAQLECVVEEVRAGEARSTPAPRNDSELGGREGTRAVHGHAHVCVSGRASGEVRLGAAGSWEQHRGRMCIWPEPQGRQYH